MPTLDEAIAEGRGAERPFNCHKHDDRNASASVNVDKNVWFCHGCGAHGVIEGNETPSVDAIVKILAGKERPRIYPERWLDIFDASEPSMYWSERFGVDIAKKYRCGRHPVHNTPTYPIRDANGAVLGVVQRRTENPKYLYPSGVSTSKTFFGQFRANPIVVLVEGAADVMALDRYQPPPQWTILGCFGAGIHAPQVALLHQLAPRLVILGFDDDDAGRSAMLRSKAALGTAMPSLSVSWSSIGGKDPADTTGNPVTAIHQVIEERAAA